MDELEKLSEELKRLQPGSAEREVYLEKLRKLVESGEYKVDAEQLARDLIRKSIVPKKKS